MSRCTRPWAWATDRARAVWAIMDERAVRGEHLFAFDDAAQRLARNQFHDQVRGALFLAVVEDVGDAHVVQQRGVPGLGPEPLEEPGIARCTPP